MAAGNRTRTRERVDRREARSRMLAAAERLLQKRPYRDLTVEDVMAEAGLSRTVFYRHFDDLPHLMFGLLEVVQAELAEEMTRTVGAPGDWEAFIDTLTGAVDVWARHGPLMRAIIDAGSYDKQIDDAYRAFRDGWVQLAAQLLDRDVAGGRLAPLNTLELARALTLLNESYLTDALSRVPPVDKRDALDTLVLIWTRTLLPGDDAAPNAPVPKHRP